MVGEAETSPGCHDSFSAMTISPTMMVIRSANIATVEQNRMGVPFGVLLDRSSVYITLSISIPPLRGGLAWECAPSFAGRPSINQRPADRRGLSLPELAGNIGSRNPKPGSGSRRMRAIPFPA